MKEDIKSKQDPERAAEEKGYLGIPVTFFAISQPLNQADNGNKKQKKYTSHAQQHAHSRIIRHRTCNINIQAGQEQVAP